MAVRIWANCLGLNKSHMSCGITKFITCNIWTAADAWEKLKEIANLLNKCLYLKYKFLTALQFGASLTKIAWKNKKGIKVRIYQNKLSSPTILNI